MKRKNQNIIFTAPGKVELKKEEQYIPPDISKMVFISNELTLVSPGTELAFFEGTHSDLKIGARKYPTGSGYSSVGIVEEVGSDVTGIQAGDRVMAMCGHCSGAWIPVFDKIPAALSSRRAVFAILGAIALHGVRDANLQIGQNVLVSGLGTIGQLATRLCRISGINKLAGADIYPFRRKTAKAGGADYILDAASRDFIEQALDISSGQGFDVVIEASGNPQAIVNALKYTAKRGKIIILGCPHGEVSLDFYRELQKKEISISGSYQPNCPEFDSSYYPWSQKRNRELIMEYQLNGKLDFAPLITHFGQAEKAQEFYNTLSEEKNKCITAVFEWNKIPE
ncbi:MAG: zinc-binding alcohol dehydrogenase [Victivallales bacterium]|jgi:2-desacetyl-2-hydroxyethyl bacteriochlorophyllide A dehydrogenase